MFDNVIIDVAIGLAVVYLVFSLLCSTLVEFVAGLLSLRGRQLERGIAYLVEDQKLIAELLAHPVLNKLSDKRRKASYIPAENFRIALLDSIQFLDELEDKERINQRLADLPEGGLKISLQAMWKDSQFDYQVFKDKVETWFSGNMVRVSGWYKRQIQKILLVVAFVLAALMNIDSIRIAKELPHNPELRQSLVEQVLNNQSVVNQVKNGVDTGQASDSLDSLSNQYQLIQQTANQLESFELPIGWHGFSQYSENFRWFDWLLLITGWFISAFAASMGADFWFSSIGKLINLRASGKPADLKK